MAVTHLSALDVGYAEPGKHTHDRADAAFAATLQATGGQSLFKKTQVTGTLQASGGNSYFKQSFSQGTLNITGARLNLQRWAQIRVFTGGGSAIAGRRSIATGGSSVISTKRVTALSVILLTPGINTGVTAAFAYEKLSARVAGTSFKVALRTHADVAITGVISWMLMN